MNKWQAALLIVVAVGVATSTAAAYPLTNIVLYDNEANWFTTDSVDAIGDDIDQRAGPETPVFTAHPSFVSAADTPILFDLQRVHYYTIYYRGTGYGERYYDRLEAALANGSAAYVIDNGMTTRVLRRDPPAAAVFEQNYCYVDTDGLYERGGGALYEYSPGDCSTHRPEIPPPKPGET